METIDALLAQAMESRRAGVFGEARDAAERAESIARHEPKPERLARALTMLADIDVDQRRPEAARPRYEEAVELYRNRGDLLLAAEALRHLGELHTEASRLDEANAALEEALAVQRADERADPGSLADSLRALGILREAQGRREEAQTLWGEARDLYAQEHDQEGVNEMNEHLGAG